MFTGEYKVLGNSSFCIMFFVHCVTQKFVLKFFINVQENLTQFNSSLKIDKEDLFKVITDLNSKTRESTVNSDMQPS